jgi:ligand-binding SRPBCC domain-containing protein
MINGRFKIWKHSHRFIKIDNKKTEVIDQIDFVLPYGFIGKLFENYVVRQLENIFVYREKATIDALKSHSTNLTH